MSTRSNIGLLMSNRDTVKYIYCHWDGYLDNNGEILLNYYNDVSKVNKLLKLGALSYLGTSIGKKQDFNAPTNEDWCLAYGRDRGETGVGARTISVDEYRDDQEFNYVFDPLTNKWYVSCWQSHSEYVPLSDALEGNFGNAVVDFAEVNATPSEPTVSGGMNPSQQEVEDFFMGASTRIRSSRRSITAADALDDDFEDPRIDEADELQARVEDDFDYVITGIERLGREGLLDEAISLLNTLADTLDSAIGIIGNDFESGVSPEEEEI